MLEFYQAYTDYQGPDGLYVRDTLRQTAIDATGSAAVEYPGHNHLDFGNVPRMSMQEAVGDLSLKGHALVGGIRDKG